MATKPTVKWLKSKGHSGMTICGIMIAYALYKRYGKLPILDFNVIRGKE